MNNIYLVGFMGTGKTAVGRRLAVIEGRVFTDIDEMIVTRENKSIADIFAGEGESYFRKVEQDVLQEVSLKPDQVVSCGGGIVIDARNIEIMKRTGLIICLSASPGVILERTRNFSHRPLLNVTDPEVKIAELLKTRAPYYGKADISIDTSDLAIDEVVEKVRKFARR